MAKVLFCLALLWVPATADLQDCVADLISVIEGMGTLTPTTTYEEMASYSGKSINDLGDYFSCCGLPSAKYVLFFVPLGFTSLALGLCGPANCTAELYYEIINNLTQSDSSLQSYVENVNSLTAQASPEVSVSIIFPKTYIQDYYTNFSAGAIVMLVVCILLVLVAAVGTVLDLLKHRKATKSQSKENYELMEKDAINAEKGSQEEQPTPMLQEVLMCFSVYTNLPKLFASRSSEKVGQNTDPLDILNGARVMSMGWVILGHVYVYRAELGVNKNPYDLLIILEKVRTAIVYGGFFAVDSFFWMSGLLMGFLLLQQLNSKRSLRLYGWIYLYAHRFYRILPVYMFVLFLGWAFTKYVGNGPMWFESDSINTQCKDYWWTNLIFLNNFLPDGNGSGCLPQSWYLANDMQFFLISPPIFFLYHRFHRLLGWACVLALSIVTVISSMVISSEHDYKVSMFAQEDVTFFTDYYIKPYCRVAPYAIGIATGMVIYSYRNYRKTGEVYDKYALWMGKALDKRFVRYGSYLVGLFFINFFIFIQYNAYQDVNGHWTNWSDSANLLFLGFNRVFWGLGLSFTLLPMLLGYNSIANWFMSHSVWTPLARLTFCTYLIHINLIYIYYLSQNAAYWLNDLDIVVDFMFVIVISYAAAVPLTLLVESPFMAFEKVVKNRRGKGKSLE